MSWEREWIFILGTWLAVRAWGCGDLVQPPPTRGEKVIPTVEFDPPLIEERTAPIVHLWLQGVPESTEVVVVQGVATQRNLQDIAKGNVGVTLGQRIVDVSVVRTQRGEVVVASHEPFELGAKYTVAVPSLGWSLVFDVMVEDTFPMATRVWPPSGEGGLFVWCLELPSRGMVDVLPRDLALVPGVPGVLESGALAGIGASCVRWFPVVDSENSPLSPPILPMYDGSGMRADPAPMGLKHQQQRLETTCPVGWVSTGPACALVEDDRVHLEAQESWLMALQWGDRFEAGVVGPRSPWTLRSLSPEATIRGVVFAATASGQEIGNEFSWQTSFPRPRVVITEVMANPVGSEPQQEWVELYNDGAMGVELGGWRLEDAGGGEDLPKVVLPAGRFGLVVGEGYDPSCWLDASPASDTILLQVSSVGKSGISNAGEPIRLVRPDGSTASQVPAIPSKRQGWSIARIHPDSLDTPPFFRFDPDGGTPGRPNGPTFIP